MGMCAAEVQSEPIVDLKQTVMGTKTGPLLGLRGTRATDEKVWEEFTDGEETSDVESAATQTDESCDGERGMVWVCYVIKIDIGGGGGQFKCSRVHHL